MSKEVLQLLAAILDVQQISVSSPNFMQQASLLAQAKQELQEAINAYSD